MFNHKKSGSFVRKLVLLTLIMIIALTAVAFRGDLLNLLAGKPTADEFTFNVESGGTFAAFDGGLAIASGTSVNYINREGERVFAEPISGGDVGLCTGDDIAAAFALGGNALKLFDSSGVKCSITTEDAILSASMNNKDQVAVTMQDGEYKGKVVVYDKKGTAVFQWFSGNAYPVKAVLSPDGKSMAILTYNNSGSRIVIQSLTSEEAGSEYLLENTIIYDIGYISSKTLAVVSAGSCIMLDGSGSEKGVYSLEGASLRGYSLEGDGFCVIAVNDFEMDGGDTLITVGENGEATASVLLRSRVEMLSARGGRIAVKYSDEVEVFSEKLKSEFIKSDTASADSVIMAEKGRMLVVYPYKAENIDCKKSGEGKIDE